jgi:hypothetical protein
MPTMHDTPKFDPNFDRRPTRDEVLARGAQLHAERTTGGQAADPTLAYQQQRGAPIDQAAANIVNQLMKKLPPEAVQFLIDHARLQSQLDQIRIIVGADSNADLVVWVRGMWSIQEDERARFRNAVTDLADEGKAQRAIGYMGQGSDRMETQRALTSDHYHHGDPEKIIDAAFETPKISTRELRAVIINGITKAVDDGDADLTQAQRNLIGLAVANLIAFKWSEHFA